ncbi:MAG: hypothetical protein NC935_03790 [Candidatus Omnitrophica bacterium]|nr:hypothetical protein [Candidatus Omnitrophota bacterium]
MREQPRSENQQVRVSELVTIINPSNPDYKEIGIGIEITTPGFTGLNLDHHGKDYNSDSPSAIERAMKLDLDSIKKNLESGKKIATIRPDPDSVGAIAVILLKLEGINPDEKIIKAIGLADRKGPGVFKDNGAKLLGLSDDEFEKYKKIVAAARYKIVSQKTPIEEAIEFMKNLLMVKISEDEIENLYKQDQKELEEARKNLEIELICNGKVAVVKGNSPRAFDIGYEKAQVVIAYNPQFKWPTGQVTPKFTIARYDSNVDYFNIKGLLQELQQKDPDWGGTENLIGSPQGRDPGIFLEELEKIVTKYIVY